uniref:Uncharacterized protein n=1 Tax=Branchiostoma floridae TaxID=7739 RepID=C3YPB4_BRAFL|eukprot:XP_002601686.1 hypothetical protein BRAFLDRAFT_94563 [Branchiostoma floridae]
MRQCAVLVAACGERLTQLAPGRIFLLMRNGAAAFTHQRRSINYKAELSTVISIRFNRRVGRSNRHVFYDVFPLTVKHGRQKNPLISKLYIDRCTFIYKRTLASDEWSLFLPVAPKFLHKRHNVPGKLSF